MKDLVIAVFGSYEPLTYVDELGNTIPVSGLAGVDWSYVLGVLLFGILLYSVMRIIGSVISRV